MRNTEKCEVMITALTLAREGCMVFPMHRAYLKENRILCSCGDPNCLAPGQHAQSNLMSNSTSDPDEIVEWFRGDPSSSPNIGVETGEGIVGVKITCNPNSDGQPAQGAKEMRDKLPKTLRLNSESLYLGFFRYDKSKYRVETNEGNMGQGVSIFGDSKTSFLAGYLPIRNELVFIPSYKTAVLVHTKMAWMPEWFLKDMVEQEIAEPIALAKPKVRTSEILDIFDPFG
ncbi:MAG: hypothetical protein PHQ41_04350 [Candidatus Cloacimonetes bacterium]|jgi:hypothetical protein|nr:hypothetical protein [Candidatus Micrarchaeota archaeon]MDD3523911.1 hypothetical protein [Candidatus Cloacimonadota bacterium]MDD5515778.1 hypothetical protein [Synergistales bacterium]